MQALQSPHIFFRRVIFEVTATECQVAMEDEHHYFLINVGHDGERITSVDSTSRRTPWTICPQAAAKLQEFVGQPLRQRIAVNLADIDGKQQCTHQYDLLMVALSQARRPGRREYIAKVIGAMHEHRRAELWLDGEKLLDWRLRGTLIDSTDQLDQKDLRNILPWAEDTLDDQTLEALYVQRRAVMVATSKGFDLDQIRDAGQVLKARSGACFVFQPERAASAVRVIGSTRDDVHQAGDLLVGWGEPVAGAER
ncbi:DUF2889 domain-containing protein [Pseudomonas saliphila]|uniref:DUF2889 domain-containing protein n=1 Tax=Pseudomonas saliphila TaxID=2586906 RepID=UPI0015B734B5|nr:DUF2889 domain-containing protein [Pseudomonas saliphila]